jgi:hypothetical protein
VTDTSGRSSGPIMSWMMETQLMEANSTSPWPLIVVPLVSIGIMLLCLIPAYLDKPVIPVGNAESGTDTVLWLVTRWYC